MPESEIRDVVSADQRSDILVARVVEAFEVSRSAAALRLSDDVKREILANGYCTRRKKPPPKEGCVLPKLQCLGFKSRLGSRLNDALMKSYAVGDLEESTAAGMLGFKSILPFLNQFDRWR